MLHNIEKRICPYSNTEFIPKRNNQIFAKKEYRVAYHNDIHNSFRRKLSAVNKEITANYKILLEILENKKSTMVHYQFLKGKKFSFSVFTSVVKTVTGHAYRLYDTAYERLDEDKYLITKL